MTRCCTLCKGAGVRWRCLSVSLSGILPYFFSRKRRASLQKVRLKSSESDGDARIRWKPECWQKLCYKVAMTILHMQDRTQDKTRRFTKCECMQIQHQCLNSHSMSTLKCRALQHPNKECANHRISSTHQKLL